MCSENQNYVLCSPKVDLMDHHITKKYTTKNEVFSFLTLMKDFDIVDEILINVPHGSPGKYTIYIGRQWLDNAVKIIPQCGKPDTTELVFFGKSPLRLLLFKLKYMTVTICRDSQDELTYEIKGFKFPSIQYIMNKEGIDDCSEEEYVMQERDQPIVTFGSLNNLRYVDGMAGMTKPFCVINERPVIIDEF